MNEAGDRYGYAHLPDGHRRVSRWPASSPPGEHRGGLARRWCLRR